MEIVADIAEVHRTLCKVAAVMMGPKMALGRAQNACRFVGRD